MNTPTDLANMALDAAGLDFTLGDIEEGSKASQVVLRAYGMCQRNLMRAVHWDFLRKQVDLQMLGDATGETDDLSTLVIAPWTYCYRYPIDCMKARFIPQSYLNPAASAVPLTTGTTQVAYTYGMRLVPAPFLLSFDPNYTVDPDSNWLQLQGESPQGSVVILTNVNAAQLVYTGFIPQVPVWDPLFRSAMVAYLASEVAMPLAKDKKFGLQMRKDQMEIARGKVGEARVANGNESGFPQTTNHTPDWMRTRNIGGAGYLGVGPGCGIWGANGYGWDGCGYMGFGFDQSVF